MSMTRTGLLLTAVVASFIGLMSAPAHAEESQCGGDLETLQQQETALELLETAHAEGEAHRGTVRGELDALAEQIRTLRDEGAKPEAIDRLIVQRTRLLGELRRSQKVSKAVGSQIVVMRTQVQDANRAYLACVEGTLEGGLE